MLCLPDNDGRLVNVAIIHTRSALKLLNIQTGGDSSIINLVSLLHTANVVLRRATVGVVDDDGDFHCWPLSVCCLLPMYAV